MMSHKNKHDTFGGLLSEVSSIDSSLFDKKSLNEARKSNTNKTSAQKPTSVAAQSTSRQTAGFATQPNRQTPTSSVPGGFMQNATTQSAKSGTLGSTNAKLSSQLDALVGDFSGSKQSRPMRPPVKSPGVASSTVLGSQSASVFGADKAGHAHDDLDDIFNTSTRQGPPTVGTSTGPSSDLLEGFGQSSAPRAVPGGDDPFDIFQSPAEGQLRPAAPATSPADDLLGGFEGTLGVEDHTAPEPAMPVDSAAVSPDHLRQEDHLDIFAPSSSSPRRAAPVVEEEYLFSLTTSMARPEGLAPSSESLADNVSSGRREDVSSQEEYRTGEQGGRGRADGDSGAARRGRPASAHVTSEATSAPQRGDRPSRCPKESQRPDGATWQSQDEGITNGQAVGAGGTDSAKEWLDKGQKWLFSAGKKVAAAAKEASSTIQSKLDEMEVFKSSGKGPRTWSPDDDAMIPEYYKQWAATIECLGPEEQARTLGQMSEDDRLIVQRIIDQSSIHRSTSRERPSSPDARHHASSKPGGSPGLGRPPGRQAAARRSPAAAAAAAAPRPPHRTRSAETLPQPSPPSRAASGGLDQERPKRSSSYNLGTASSNGSDKARPSGSSPASPERAPSAGMPPKPPSSSPPPKQAPLPARQEKQVDFLGLFGDEDAGTGAASPAQPSAAASSRAGSAADLFDMGDSPGPHSPAADVDILGMFASSAPAAGAGSTGAQKGPAAKPPPGPSGLDELFGAPRKAGESMIDFGDEASSASAVSTVAFSAPGDQDVEGEPEIRRQLRAKRLAEKQAAIQAALAEKLARDSAESTEKERKVQLRDEFKERMKAWQQGKDGNIRALLSSLDTVLWENSGWKKPAMTDLLEPQRVKRAYMKANLVVHPDKVKQKGGTVEQIVIADIAFDALKGAWAKFEAAEMR